jgi:hypothetical protein
VTHKSHETLSASEQAELLRMAGLTPDMVAAVEHSTPTMVADVVIDEPVESHVKVDDGVVTAEAIVKRILDRAAGNREKALKLVDEHIQAEFDRIKLSKMQAATKGLDEKGKSEHNKAAWKHCQQLREHIKTEIRAAFRDSGGFVKAKIKKGSKATNPELDAFMLQHQDSEILRQFLALQGGAQ